MADYAKLTNYLEGNKNAGPTTSESISSGLSGITSSMSGLFGRSQSTNSVNDADQQTDSWFREADKDDWCPKMSRTQKILGFCTFIGLGIFFMTLASFYLPIILLKPRKFCILFSCGSACFLFSFTVLWGFKSHMKHLMSASRLPFSMSYLTTLLGTLFVAIYVQSLILTLIFAVLQVCCLVWYLISYLPGGQSGLKFMTKMCFTFGSKAAKTTLSV